MKHNRVLIVSGIPFRNDTNLGKTLCTLFSAYRPEELAQLYFSPQTPNVTKCNTYYQISEEQLIRSCFGIIKKRCGRIIDSNHISKASSSVESHPKAAISLRHFIGVSVMRDYLWMFSAVKTKKLNNWLQDVNPTALFFLMPQDIKSSRIIEYVVSVCNCPLVMFVTDDYYNDPSLKPGLLRRWYFKKKQESLDLLCRSVSIVVGCSELASSEFGKKYNVSFETLFTPSGIDYLNLPIHSSININAPVIFRYFGNLGLERWKPLVELGHAIASYNCGEQKAVLEVYSNLRYPEAIAQLEIPNGCVFKGWVQGDEYMRLLQEADVAVHVESFSEEMCRRTRLSVSTKIADYLGAGKCILCVGRADLASVQHIQDVACVVDDPLKITEKLGELIENSDYRLQLSVKARDKALKQHNIKVIPNKLREIIKSLNDITSDAPN